MPPDEGILVCGVTGFIGSALARRLIDEGQQVFGLCRRESRNLDRIADLNRMELLECPDDDADALRALLAKRRFRAVYNMATYGVHGAQQCDRALRSANQKLVENLLRSVNAPKLVVHAGSVFEYTGGEPGTLINEDAPTEPFSAYGRAKLRATRTALRLARELSLPVAVLRLFHVYGPGEAASRLTPMLLDRLQRSLPVELTSGTQVRDFLYIDDAVDACCRALQFIERRPDRSLFNICRSTPVTIRQVGEALARQLDRPQSLLRWGALPPRKEEPQWLVGENSRFCEATGWRPQHSLEAGLRKLVEQSRIRPPHHGGSCPSAAAA